MQWILKFSMFFIHMFLNTNVSFTLCSMFNALHVKQKKKKHKKLVKMFGRMLFTWCLASFHIQSFYFIYFIFFSLFFSYFGLAFELLTLNALKVHSHSKEVITNFIMTHSRTVVVSSLFRSLFCPIALTGSNATNLRIINLYKIWILFDLLL